VAGVTTLLHEAWEPARAERGHTSGEEVGTIAVEAGVSRLLITHNHPLPGVPERTAAAAQTRFDAAISASDGSILEL
jgi:ribonuclease BN (tRNA processing enzyme)